MKTHEKFVNKYGLAISFEHVSSRLNTLISSGINAMRVEYDQCESTSRKRFDDLQASEAKCEELAAQLAAMKQERDEIQLRLHAVDHAYNEQQALNGPASDLMMQAKALIERQRQFIRTLYTSRNKPKKHGRDCMCVKCSL